MNLLPSYRISSLNVQSLTPAAAQLYRVANLNSNYLSPHDTIARELRFTEPRQLGIKSFLLDTSPNLRKVKNLLVAR